MLICTSGFMNDVMFSYHGTYRLADGHGVCTNSPVAAGRAQAAVGRTAR